MSTIQEVKRISTEGNSDILVIFYMTTCAPCSLLKQKMTKICSEKMIPLININVAGEMDFVHEMGIRTAPTVMLVRKGEAKILFSGDIDVASILKHIEENGIRNGAFNA